MANTVRVIVCRVGKDPVIEDMPNTLAAMQSLVGGWVEQVTLGDGLYLFCNEEGTLQQLPPNRTIGGTTLVGDFFVCRSAGESLASVRDDDLPKVKSVLR